MANVFVVATDVDRVYLDYGASRHPQAARHRRRGRSDLLPRL
jgi:carbamate kinase